MKIIEASDVEWYYGRNARTCPKRVKVDGVWREVFSFEKKVFEEFASRSRYTIFVCHIGDNEMVKVKVGC